MLTAKFYKEFPETRLTVLKR